MNHNAIKVSLNTFGLVDAFIGGGSFHPWAALDTGGRGNELPSGVLATCSFLSVGRIELTGLSIEWSECQHFCLFKKILCI